MGLGYSWLPDYQANPYLQSGKLIEVSEDLSIDLALYWHHWKQQSAQLEQLTQLLTQKAQELLN